MNPSEEARSLLREWKEGRPANFYDCDAYLQAALTFALGSRLTEAEPALRRAGADSAGPVNDGCSLVDRPDCLPQLIHWNELGERVDEIRFHPTYHAIGRLVWQSGILAVLATPGNVTLHSALSYLFALNGETPHLCAVACSAGLIKAIQRCGDDWMREVAMPRLVESDYDRRLHGAQFLTEVQGGSDVGTNACVARQVPGEPQWWRLTGEKWFCSNASADLYAVSARPEGAAGGTSGLGLFLVPRRLQDGSLNGVVIRRLKDKLGTRPLPTAEVDFHDALACQLGSLADGFRLMMGVIINTSRLGIGVTSSGLMRRAFLDALRYARIRRAFGRPLEEFPAIRQILAEMHALGLGGLAFTLFVAKLEDDLVLAGRRPEDEPLFRTAINILKYVSSVDAARVVHHGIEVLGGNGTIEDFSVLPRLYRESIVHESWEGPHNTLMAQILRDIRRSKMHEAFLDETRNLLHDVSSPAFVATRDRGLANLEDVEARVRRVLNGESEVAALHVRGLVYRMARTFQAALLLSQAATDVFKAQADLLHAAARFLFDSGGPLASEPMDDPEYADRLKHLVLA